MEKFNETQELNKLPQAKKHWKKIEEFVYKPKDPNLKQEIIHNLKRQQGLRRHYKGMEQLKLRSTKRF